MLNLEIIKTDTVSFIRRKERPTYNPTHCLEGMIFDEFPGEPALYSKEWMKVAAIPQKIEKNGPNKQENPRFVLIDPSLASDKIPAQFLFNEVIAPGDSYYEAWENNSNLQSLYRYEVDTIPGEPEDVPFQYEIIMEIDKIEEYAGFLYPVQKTRWIQDGNELLDHRAVQHEEIDIILFPGIILPARTSFLTSEQSYKIVRSHVKNHIDRKYAVVSSDYDFCFTVKKKIDLCAPESYSVEVGSSRRPKKEKRYNYDRQTEVFKMTWAGYSGKKDGYEGYPPIKPFKGKNLQDLKEKIDSYLADLMELINEPVKDCPTCNGRGVVFTAAGIQPS